MAAAAPNTYLRLRLPGALFLTAGVAAAAESAAIAIGAGPAHHLPLLGDLYSPVDGIRWLSNLNGHCVITPWQQHTLLHRAATHPCTTPASLILAINAKCAVIFAAGFVPFVGLRLVEAQAKRQAKKGRAFAAVRAPEGAPPPVVIELGRATGTLNALGHAAGIRKGQRVRLVGDDVSQDTLVLGGKGAGKTIFAQQPIMLQAFKQDCGALVFNVKGDVDRQVLSIAKMAGRKVRVLGVGGEAINLLAGVTPEMAAAFMSSLLLLAGGQDKGAMFWNATGTNLTRGVLGLLWYFPARYSLPGLYRYIFIKAYRADVDRNVEVLLSTWRAALATSTGEDRVKIQRQIDYVLGCIQEIANFNEQTHEIQSGTKMHLSMILAKTVLPELEAAFCKPENEDDGPPFAMESLYEDGDIVVINAPLQEFGTAAAAIMCFAKLRFYVTMEQRRLRTSCNKTRRVGLFIDEVQYVATCSQEGMSDHKFLSISRDTGTFAVFGTQSLSALDAKIGVEMRKALTANLRNRIVFRTEDWDTIHDTLRLLGRIEQDRKTTSTTKQPGSWFPSKGESHAESLQDTANAALFRNLAPQEAVALLSIDNASADDVLQMTPVYA